MKQTIFFFIFATVYVFINIAVKDHILQSYQVKKTLQLEGKSLTSKNLFASIDFNSLLEINKQTHVILSTLQQQKFYRTIKVPKDQQCLYFKQQEEHAVCKNKSCSICRCEQEEIPLEWRKEDKNECYIKTNDGEDEKEEKEKYEWYWNLNQEDEFKDGEYVDLVENIEGYTANKEPNIWKIIYTEDCFQGQQLTSEKMVLNSIISGFHASVSSHICEFYQDLSKEEVKLNPSWEFYFEKVGNYEDRIQNLLFYYEFLLRAVQKSSEVFLNFPYKTGDSESDRQVVQLIERFTSHINSQNKVLQFDINLFKSQDSAEIKKNYQKYVKNIAQLMDCVSCEKCKLFAKIQVQGISLAMNIIFADNSDERVKYMKRNELIVLINTLHKSSESIQIINKMYQRKYDHYSIRFYIASALLFGACLAILKILLMKLKPESTKQKIQ
ncbi:hypothetical protein ABPG74_016434 [Tetrahymena malaccensis]